MNQILAGRSRATDVVARSRLIEGAMKQLAENCLLVDVRTPGEYDESHIDGSINVPLHEVADRVGEIRSAAGERQVALVCRTGQRAEKAREALGGELDCELHVLPGGVARWEEEGLPLNRGKGVMSLERQVRIAAGSLVVIGVALGVLVHPGFLGLAGFVGAGLVFAGVTDTCGMGMMLARMPWNQRRARAACAVR